MTQKVTNFARFYGILKERFTFASKELGEEFKESLVSQFTNGRTTSLREMSLEEYDEMCDRLDGTTALIRKSIEAEHRRLRSRCLRQMQQLGIDTTDWSRINAFCQDPRICGKPFRQLSQEELEQLSVKLRAISRKGGFAQRKSAGNGGCSALGAGNGGGSALALLVPLDEEGWCS